jgi:hypothetical protein
MAEKLEALRALLAKVEAGKVSAAPWGDVLGVEQGHNAWRAYHHGSLDAAKALHEAVLPGWQLDRLMQGDDRWEAQVGNPNADWEEGTDASPARAWLIAILKALIAQEEA